VILGENVQIHPYVSIGNSPDGETIIGNNVTLFEGAKILGGVKIGDNSLIGINEIIDHDVLPNSKIGNCNVYKRK